MILCNQHCVNYQCNKRAKGHELAIRGNRTDDTVKVLKDLRSDNCGFKLDFLRDDNINEFVSNKIEDE